MPGKPSSLPVILQWASRHWLSLTIAAFVAIFVFAGAPAWAADSGRDIYQTVPPSTPEVPVPQPPEPTPRPDHNNDNNNNDENNAAPTPVPPPAGEAAAAPAAPAGTDMTAVVNGATINVRQGPGTTFPIVGTLPGGTSVTVVGRNGAGTWWKSAVCPAPNTRLGQRAIGNAQLR